MVQKERRKWKIKSLAKWNYQDVNQKGCLIRMNKSYDDGAPCARKLACTVRSGGKAGEYEL